MSQFLRSGCVPLASGAQYDPVTGEVVGEVDPWRDVALPLSRQVVLRGHESAPWSMSANGLARVALAERAGLPERLRLSTLYVAVGRALVVTSDPGITAKSWEVATAALNAPRGVVAGAWDGADGQRLALVDEAVYAATLQVLMGWRRAVETLDADLLSAAVDIVSRMARPEFPTMHEPCARLWWRTERELRTAVAPEVPGLPEQDWERTAAAVSA